MSGDFSKFTFDPKKQYSKVLMQQGRVILDSDWNEMQEIISRNNQLLVHDLVGEVAYPVDNPAFTPEVRGGLKFDGEDDFVLVDKENLDFSGKRHFSIMATVTPMATEEDAVIFSQWQQLFHLGIESGLCFGLKAQGEVFLQRTIDSAQGVEIDTLISGETVEYGTQVQLCVTFNGDTVSLYINQKRVAQAKEAASGFIEIAPVTIGATLKDKQPVRCFNGVIHEVAVWSRALSEKEMLPIPFNHRAVGEVGLQAWWPLSESMGEVCNDITGSDNTGLLGAGVEKNMPGWLSPTLSFSPGRVYLDGTLSEQFDDVSFDYRGTGNFYFLAYLKMKQVMVSAQDDPKLLDPALDGIDTTMRTQSQLAVQLFPHSGGYDNEAELKQKWCEYKTDNSSNGCLKFSCLNNRPLFENTLYRVQVYQSSDLQSSNTLNIVWTADNSSLNYKVTRVTENTLTLHGLANSNTPLTIGSYFSLIDADGNYLQQSKNLLTVADIDYEEEAVTFKGKIDHSKLPITFQHWQTQVNEIACNEHGEYRLNIDNRLRLVFAPEARYKQGEFWLIPARRASNAVTLPENTWHEPVDAKVIYQPIAEFRSVNAAVWVSHDYRKPFHTAVDMDNFIRKSGGTFTGPVVMEEPLRLEGDTQVNGFLNINGGVSKHFVGTAQLKDRAVTHHKIQPNLGLHLGQCLLSQNPVAAPGYAVIGKLAADTENSAWRVMANRLPYEAPFVALNSGDRVFIFYGNGRVFEMIQNTATSQIEFIEKNKRPGSAVRRFGACALNNRLYIAGGESAAGEKTAEFYCYSVINDTWERKEDLRHPVSHITLCAEAGKVYAMGGLHTSFFGLLKHDPSSDNTRYHPESDTWETMADMPDYRYSGSAVAVNGLIHYIGGSDRELSGIFSEAFQDANFVYSPAEDRWRARQPIPLPRSRFGMMALNEKIYCLGGRTGLGYTADVRVYNPETDTWEAEASLNFPRSHIGAVIANGFLIALGGKIAAGYGGAIEEQQRCSEFYVHRLENYL
jgi:N-acetylneuraminic acid mutarotase